MNRIFALLLLIVFVGCSAETSSDVSVSGVITSHGNPLQGAKVMFIPTRTRDSRRQLIPIAFGETDEQGRYELSTPGGGLGVSLGSYRVMVSKVEPLVGSGDPETDLDLLPVPGDQPTMSPVRKRELLLRAYLIANPHRGPQPLGETVFAGFNVSTELKFDVLSGGTDQADFEVGQDLILSIDPDSSN